MRLVPTGVLAFGMTCALALAHPGDHEVVPAAERERARELHAAGPAENRGVDVVRVLGQVSLAGEFDTPENRALRAREIVIAPGGAVAVHEHQGRPGVAYILSGEVYEHRSDRDAPLLRRAGDAAFEYSGLVHWWENRGDEPVRALVVDVIPR